MKKLLTLCILVLGTCQFSFAAHIVSGNMQYHCVSPGNYEVSMIIYRDCNTGGADFDNPAVVAVYREDLLVLLENPTVSLVESIPPQPYEDCEANNPNYCIERGVYNFSISLPISDQAYSIVYQRCCWSELVTNIESPETTGITVKADISPLAQQVCNAQQSIDFPLTFSACPGTAVSYEFPVIDSEGDSLVYELCTPLEGAGPVGIPDNPGNTSQCDGILPDPPCPGPYFPVPYAAGFSEDNPFPTENGIILDPVTGTLSFTPTIVGRFIFGLCITEYRDGQILGYYSQPVEILGALDVPVTVDPIPGKDAWSISQFHQEHQLILKNEIRASEVKVSLIDIQGKVSRMKSFKDSDRIAIPLNNLSAGIYFINIEQDGGQQTMKIVL